MDHSVFSSALSDIEKVADGFLVSYLLSQKMERPKPRDVYFFLLYTMRQLRDEWDKDRSQKFITMTKQIQL